MQLQGSYGILRPRTPAPRQSPETVADGGGVHPSPRALAATRFLVGTPSILHASPKSRGHPFMHLIEPAANSTKLHLEDEWETL